jgi:membrane-associated phospholipid phosphatase
LKIRAARRTRRYVGRVPEVFYRLPRNVIGIFSGRNLLWHAAAILLTIVIVTSGGDWAYYRCTRAEVLSSLALPALRLGMVMPVLGNLAILLAGVAARNRRLITTAWALVQSALLALLIASCYKAVTGRLHPPWHGHLVSTGANPSDLVDSSHGFQLGFLRGGIFWGWPSGHTTTAFSMSLCLVMLYPRNKIVLVGALLYAFYIGLSVSVTIHWLSEFVAGALIGSVIGMTVGRSFSAKALEQTRAS